MGSWGTKTEQAVRAEWWIAAFVGYALVAALFQPLTWPAAVAVLAPGLILLAIRVRRTVRPLPRNARPGRAGAQWIGLGLALAAWEAVAWRWGNDAAHPTLSLLLDPVLEHYPARVLGYAGWLILGGWLVTR